MGKDQVLWYILDKTFQMKQLRQGGETKESLPTYRERAQCYNLLTIPQ